jgi:uncharacterized protein YcbX
MTVPVTVSRLAIAPVKGMRMHGASKIRLGRHGVIGDREFLVIGEDGTLLLTSRTPALVQVEAAWDRAREVLALRFPDGHVVRDTPGPGACAVTRMYDGREIPGRVIPGPLSAALSGYLGRQVRLFRREPEHIGHGARRYCSGPAPVPHDHDDGRPWRMGRTRLGRAGGRHRRGHRARHSSRAALCRHDPEPGLGRH